MTFSQIIKLRKYTINMHDYYFFFLQGEQSTLTTGESGEASCRRWLKTKMRQFLLSKSLYSNGVDTLKQDFSRVYRNFLEKTHLNLIFARELYIQVQDTSEKLKRLSDCSLGQAIDHNLIRQKKLGAHVFIACLLGEFQCNSSVDSFPWVRPSQGPSE